LIPKVPLLENVDLNDLSDIFKIEPRDSIKTPFAPSLFQDKVNDWIHVLEAFFVRIIH
jgi:hypothetical protein